MKIHNISTKKDLIWYVSYGSNLSYDRFICYLLGGKPNGSTKTYLGSSDRDLPIDSALVNLNYSLYFAKNSSVWYNCGVCFLNDKFDESEYTIGRKYLISKIQFLDLFKQENNINYDVIINFEALKKNKSLVVDKSKWYGKLLYLGTNEGIDNITFTCNDYTGIFNKPHPSYLSTICKGIFEITKWDNDKIINYLLSKKGVSGNYNFHQINDLIDIENF